MPLNKELTECDSPLGFNERVGFFVLFYAILIFFLSILQ